MDYLRILKEAIVRIPQLKYAYGILALVSVAMIIKSYGIGFQSAVFSVIVLILLMGMLVLFVKFAQIPYEGLRILALTFAWVVFLGITIFTVFLFSCVFLNKPLNHDELKNLLHNSDKHQPIKLKIAIASSAASSIEEELKNYENYQKSAFKSNGIDFSLEIERYTNLEYYKVLDNLESGQFDIVMIDDPFVMKYETYLTDLRTIDCKDQAVLNSDLKSQFIENLFQVCEIKKKGHEKLVGLPFTGNVQLMLINSHIADESQQIKILVDQCLLRFPPELQTLMSCDLSLDGRRTPIGIRCDTRDNLTEIFWELLSLQKSEIRVENQNRLILDRIKAQTAVSWMKKVAKKYLDPKLDAQKLISKVSNGDMVMVFGWANWAGTFLNSDELGNIKVAQVSEHPTLGCWMLGIPESSKFKCDALRVIKDLCLNVKIQNSLATHGITPVYSNFSNAAEITKHNVFWDNNATLIEDAINNARPRPRVMNWKDIEKQMGKMVWECIVDSTQKLHDIKNIAYFR